MIRKSSKATLRVPHEDWAASLEQKNAMIAGLQSEL